MTDIAVLVLNNCQGYDADQCVNGLTLGDMKELVDDAVDRFGKDAKIVTRDTGNRYGANWGAIAHHEEIYLWADEDEEEDE